MEKVSKPLVIARAWLNRPSKIEDWLQERRDICETCPLNSKNLKDNNLLDRLKPRCIGCGCPIDEKTSQKTEMCGAADIGDEPKWPALVVETRGNTFLNMENESPNIVNVDLTTEEYVVDYGEIKVGATSDVSMVFSGSKDIEPIEAKSSCSCTATPIPEQIDSKSMRVEFSIKNTAVGNISSIITVYYKFMGLQKNLRIRLKAKIIK